MPLDLRTDLLADVALAASGRPMAEDERRRIAGELADLPAMAEWIERVAPGVMERARLGVRIAAPPEEEEPVSSDAAFTRAT
jgi:hypothetical protein